MARHINRVEDLFEDNPLVFDDCEVSNQLARKKKMAENADLMKNHV